MSFVLNLTFWAFFINLALAVLVASSRADRPVNRAFLFLSFSCGLWLIGIWVGNHQRSAPALELWVRLTTMVALLMPLSLFLLTRVVITGKELSACARAHWGWVAITAAEVALCGTHFFIRSVAVPADPQLIATPDYGPGFVAYVGWYLSASVVTEVQAWRARRKLSAIARLELDCIFIGILFFNLFAIVLAGIAPLFWKNTQTHQLAPLWMVLLDGVVVYGISTRKLLGASSLARRGASYALLILYLSVLYAVAWAAARLVLHPFGLGGARAPHLLAAVATALCMGPAQALSRRIVQKLFVNIGAIDPKAGIDALDAVRAETISMEKLAFGALRIFARLAGADAGSVHLFSPAVAHRLDFQPVAGALSEALRGALVRGPVVAALLPRQNGPKELEMEMRALDAAIAIGIPGETEPQGAIVLGERLSGKLYDADAVTSLQAMAAHLGVALANARLYLEKARTTIYQSTVLDQLAVGVIAVDAERNVSTFNREAARILAASEGLLPPRILTDLPLPLRTVIEETADIPVLEKEIVLGTDTGKPLWLRVACRRFLDADGRPLGTSLTCQDISPLKLLKQQLVEVDRMATLGQFSAMVAHEIRNPLVAIRAYGQLIPERLGNMKFFIELSVILEKEVERIETILRQLLAWGKVSQRKMEPVQAEEILEGVLVLYRPELRKRNIVLSTAWPETQKRRPVRGEPQRLQQAFSNLILNAIQAMPEGGRLHAEIGPAALFSETDLFDARESGDYLGVTLSDDGIGMGAEELSRLFQSTEALVSFKPGGSGFGLSIVKQIVSEHRGALTAESRPGEGSRFRILLPLWEARAVSG